MIFSLNARKTRQRLFLLSYATFAENLTPLSKKSCSGRSHEAKPTVCSLFQKEVLDSGSGGLKPVEG
jgi:hypothetical protein